MRKILYIFFLVFVFFALPKVSNVKAAGGCTYNSQCNGNPCACPGGTAWCDSGGTCQYTCNNSCVATVTNNTCNCASYGGWSGCSGGYETRDCVSYNGPCPPPDIYQIRACPTSGGGGGGGSTNTPPPGCTTGGWTNGACGGGGCPATQREQTRTVSPAGCASTSQCVADAACGATATNTPRPITCEIFSAVLSPSSATADVGSGATFTLTVNDSPAGCSNDAYFVRSNTNASITSTNPDTSEPFTATVYCNSAGSTSITGQGRIGGVSQASDTSTITCSALPTSPVTLTPVPGQCNAPSLSGSGTCSGTNLILNYSWGAITGASQYRTQVSRSSSFSTLVTDTSGFSTSYSTTQPGGTYYARTRVNSDSGSCASPSNWSNVVAISNNCGSFVTFTPTPVNTATSTPSPQPPAQITLTPVVLNGVGDTGIGFVTVSPPSATLVGSVNFVISGTPGIATVSSPDSPAGAPYTTNVTAVSIGNTTYTVVATDNNGNVVTATGTIEVKNPAPWCQAKEGDVIAGRVNPLGNVYCPIPNVCTLNPACDPSIITFDPAEAPGVVIAGGGVNPGSGQSSQSPYNFTVTGDKYDGPTYDYTYFDSKAGSVPFNSVGANPVSSAAQLTGAPLYSGYKWYKYSGNLTLGTGAAIDLGSNRVVLFVNGNLTINSKINVNNGSGFFMVVVNGDITVSPTVHDANAFGASPDTNPELEGLYFATGTFKTGTAGTNPDGTGNDQQLHIRGSVAVSNFALERNLPDNSGISSELFEYGPDQVMLMPSILSRKQVIWREVAP